MVEDVIEQSNVEEEKPLYNQKPRLLARILSALVDMFLIFLGTFLFMQIEMRTPISQEYHRLRDELIVIIDNTKLETNYGHKLYEDEENYVSYTASYRIYQEEDQSSDKYQKNYVVINNSDISKETSEAYNSAIKNNGTYQSHYLTYRAINYGMTMIAVSATEVILLLVIPLTNKRRATLGKFAAMTSLISNKEAQAKWWQVLIRFLFVLLVESALPLLYFSEFATLLIVGGVNAITMLISRKTGRTLRDYVSLTRIIDKKSFKPINEQ